MSAFGLLLFAVAAYLMAMVVVLGGVTLLAWLARRLRPSRRLWRSFFRLLDAEVARRAGATASGAPLVYAGTFLRMALEGLSEALWAPLLDLVDVDWSGLWTLPPSLSDLVDFEFAHQDGWWEPP